MIFFSRKLNNKKEDVKNKTAVDFIKEGEKYANKNNLKESLNCFDTAINLDPKNDLALGDKALILDVLGKHDEALTFFFQGLGNKSS